FHLSRSFICIAYCDIVEPVGRHSFVILLRELIECGNVLAVKLEQRIDHPRPSLCVLGIPAKEGRVKLLGRFLITCAQFKPTKRSWCVSTYLRHFSLLV